MANETTIGELSINLKMKLEGLEKGLETAKKKMQEMEKQNQQVQNSNKGLEGSYLAMSAVAVASLMKISSIVKNCVDEYKEYTQAMSSLQNVSEYTGESMSDFSNIMDRFGQYMTKSDMATTIKNFSLMGMTAEQTEKMMEALTNSAIRNRNANYTVSEAVRVASEGYRQGLSTLSDSAGVTENLSVMLDNYAKSIGKTASQLTEAEKNQAYLNRTMYAAEPFASAMADYTETLAGKQGEYSQALRETQVAYAEALEPTLSSITTMGTEVLKITGQFIKDHPVLVSGATSFGTTLAGVTVALVALATAKKAYATATGVATMSTKAFTTALLANPLTWIAVGIAGAISGLSMLTTAIKENEEATAKLEETTKRYNEIKNGTFAYTDSNIAKLEDDKAKIEEQIELLNKQIDLEQKIQELKNKKVSGSEQITKNMDLTAYETQLTETKKQLEEARKENNSFGDSLEQLNRSLSKTTKGLEKANAIKNISKAFDTDAIKNQQKEAAQLKINAQQLQNYLSVLKKSDKTSDEYQQALQAVSKSYPEAVSAAGPLITVLEGITNAQQLQADEAWNASQTSIQGHIANIQQALNDENVQRQVATNMGIAYDENFKPKLEAILALLQMIGGYTPTEVPNITPKTSTKRSTKSSSYSNKALDNYKKEIEYKKSLDQLSLQQEISMYQTALKKYAKTTDEKRELTTKIYELTKELAQKEKEVLDQQTKEYERYIENQKNLRGAEYATNERASDLDKIINMHQNYLNQILHDERLSLEERKEIYEEELDTIRDYEQQKRDLRVESIDNTVSQLTSAITKQIEEMQEADEEAINKNIELIEKWKDTRIEAINEEYNARIKAIQDELDALDKAEQQKTRDEEDTEYEKKKLRLEQLIAYEHDATTKANYEKELAKLIEDHNKIVDKRVLDDKKQALKDQQDILKDEQSAKIEAITQEAERQKEQLQTQLDNIKRYYDKQKEMAQENAQAMLLNVEQNQEQILSLLQNYGDDYEITGQTFGEKLGQGFAETAMQKIQNAISAIQVTIDSAIESNIARLTSLNTKISSGIAGNTVINKTVNVEQNNTITSPVDSPSVTWKKQETLNRNLADSLSRVF